MGEQIRIESILAEILQPLIDGYLRAIVLPKVRNNLSTNQIDEIAQYLAPRYASLILELHPTNDTEFFDSLLLAVKNNIRARIRLHTAHRYRGNDQRCLK